MKKIGPNGMKWLKIIHVFLVVLFFGGILSSVALNFWIDFTKYDEAYHGYKNMVTISDHVVRWGAVGTLFSRLYLRIFHPLGIFLALLGRRQIWSLYDPNRCWHFCRRPFDDCQYGIIGNAKGTSFKQSGFSSKS
ncbi:hypothetical protein [Anoxybacillus sp. P3H1B]|nr:hypothetical protein [Anoxybacillus sp. P3H1B]